MPILPAKKQCHIKRTYITLILQYRSVLEAGRTLTLAEKGGAGAEEIKAAPGFRIVATMNPGGDFGLSPALANRFTTVWVPAFEDINELASILRPIWKVNIIFKLF